MFASWLQPRIVLIDAGMATELSRLDQHNMLHLFQAFAELDGAAMAKHALAFAGPAQRCIDAPAFTSAVAECAPTLDFRTAMVCQPTALHAALLRGET